jgi:hypothetical protein
MLEELSAKMLGLTKVYSLADCWVLDLAKLKGCELDAPSVRKLEISMAEQKEKQSADLKDGQLEIEMGAKLDHYFVETKGQP